MSSPNKELSSLISNRLVELGLIRAASKDSFEAKLVSGEMSEEDWLLEIDLSPKNESVQNG